MPMKTNIATMPFDRLQIWLFAAALVLVSVGCTEKHDPIIPREKIQPLPSDPTVPVYLRGTIRDLTQTENTSPYPVTSYGLVTGLRGTGDSTAPNVVRQWMLKEMSRHRLGSASSEYRDISREKMLDDPSVAIVIAATYIPAGARKGDTADVFVQCLPGNTTSSLANGMLWRVSMHMNGIADPEGAVNEFAKAQGNLFVNPAYASAKPDEASLRASLRVATIPGGALVTTDRPIWLRLRNPSWPGSRAVETRVNYFFQTPDPLRDPTAQAQDEGYIYLFMPRKYKGDTEHFLGVVNHLFLNSEPSFAAMKARELAAEAVKPDAPLYEISYAFEALGKPSLEFLTPLLSNPAPEVQFAAARAAAFLGDPFAEQVLLRIAATDHHPFRINAVQTLGQLPESLQIDAGLVKLLDSPESLLRIEAYRVLVNREASPIFSTLVQSNLNPDNGFVLDIISSSGPPLIYCTRVGKPRVAIFGHRVSMTMPVMFTAFDSRLTIANQLNRPSDLNIFYRDPGRREPIEALSSPDVAEIVARLGGAGNNGMHFTYGDIVAILQKMSANRTINAPFMLQTVPGVERAVETAPTLASQQGRPQGNEAVLPGTTSSSLPEMQLPVVPKEAREEMDKRKAAEDLRLKKENALMVTPTSGAQNRGTQYPGTPGSANSSASSTVTSPVLPDPAIGLTPEEKAALIKTEMEQRQKVEEWQKKNQNIIGPFDPK